GMARKNRTPKNGTTSEQAYRLNLHGMNLLRKAGTENLARSIEALREAVRIDPNYAEAWAGLALAYFARSTTLRPEGTEYDSSMDAVNHALNIDPNSSAAYSALCANRYRFDYDSRGAGSACRRALELDPNASDAHHVYALLLGSLARHDEAIAEIKAAIDLEPASFFFHRSFANALYLGRRYDEAVERYKKNIELDPRHEPTYYWLTKALEAQGNETEAFEYFIRLLKIQNADETTTGRYQSIFRDAGYRGVLRERASNINETNTFRVACWYARLDEKDAAFDYLERSFARKDWAITNLRVEPQLDPLLHDPRYTDLVRRLGGQ
ncbi:MAG: tetratricopeptide repeat protein, partial [Pyrinomonadaceae bacterium]